jgi:hypothetical protein
MHNEFTAVFERDGEWRVAYWTRRSVLAVLLSVTVALTACGSSTPTSATPPTSVTGAWTGTLIQPGGLVGAFDYRMQLTQIDNQVSGTTHIDIPAQPQVFADFVVTGIFDPAINLLVLQETRITAQVLPPGGAWCLKSASLQFSANPRRMAGSWTSPGCPPGTINVSGQ